jgi:hypothetical protein
MLWKIVSSPTDRQIKFVKDKREQFGEELMKLLGNPEKDHDKLCEDVEKQFYEIASKYFAPLVRDARLSIMQPALEARAIRRVQEDTKVACKKILSMQMTD